MHRCLFAILGMIAIPLSAAAQTAPRGDVDGRFTLRDTPQGMVRMDTRTGTMSICGGHDATFTCRLVPDDRQALEDEITRLKAENETLRRGQAGAPNRPGDEPRMQLPSEQEIDRALGLFERIWRRIIDMTRQTDPNGRPL